MKNKYTIDDIKEVAKSRNGECISNTYTNTHTKLKWRCSQNHIWEATPHKVISGSWCPVCAIERRRIGIEEFQQIASNKGGECLSKIYINLKTKLEWRCKDGHIWWAIPSHIKYSNQWCPICAHINLGKSKIKYDIDKDKLALLCKEGLMIREIAQKFNCPPIIIIRRIKKYNIIRNVSINNRQQHDKRFGYDIKIEPELLWGLYWGEELPLKKIAEIFDCYDSAILKRFKKYGIPTLSISEAINRNESHKGAKNWSWKGGISYVRGEEWDKIRKQIYYRDNYTCQLCERNDVKLNCHHIIPYSENQDNSKDNLITLCTSCHGKIDTMYTNQCKRPFYFDIINRWRFREFL